MAILKTKRLLLPCIFWAGEVLTDSPEYAFLKALGFTKHVTKLRTYVTEAFSFDYMDNQGVSERINIFQN